MSRSREVTDFFRSQLRPRLPADARIGTAVEGTDGGFVVRVELNGDDKPEYHRLADEVARTASDMYDVSATALVYTSKVVSREQDVVIEFTGASDAMLLLFQPSGFSVPVYLPAFLGRANAVNWADEELWRLAVPQVYEDKAMREGIWNAGRIKTLKSTLGRALLEAKPSIEALVRSQSKARIGGWAGAADELDRRLDEGEDVTEDQIRGLAALSNMPGVQPAISALLQKLATRNAAGGNH
jgi:hypothetical protein